MDEKISFINENNNLARRIIDIGRRKEFITGLVQDSSRKSPELTRRSISVNKEPLTNRNYVIGSLNSELRKQNQQIIIKGNSRLAKTLVKVKPMVDFKEMKKNQV